MKLREMTKITVLVRIWWIFFSAIFSLCCFKWYWQVVIYNNNQALIVQNTYFTNLLDTFLQLVGLIWWEAFPHWKRHDLFSSCLDREKNINPTSTYWEIAPLDLVHIDFCGPMKPSVSAVQYFHIFVNDHWQQMWVYNLNTKYQSFQIFKEFKAHVEWQSVCHIHLLNSNQRREYTSDEI